MPRLRWIACLCAALAGTAAQARPTNGPAVPGFGAIVPVPTAANTPDPHLRYRVMFSVTKAAEAPAKLSPSLDKVARFLNLLGSRGIRPEPNDIVVILHGPATATALTDDAYRARFGVPNPNLPLIQALRRSGAAIHVCGQALAAQKIDPSMVSGDVTIDLSAMTTIATLQLRGWALMPE